MIRLHICILNLWFVNISDYNKTEIYYFTQYFIYFEDNNIYCEFGKFI